MLLGRKFYLSAVISYAALSCFNNAWAIERKPFTVKDNASFELTAYSLDQITPILPLLEDWVRREFVQYPYLWVPQTKEYYPPNAMMVEEKNGLVTLVRQQGKVIGVASGVAFDSELLQTHFEQPLLERAKEQGFDPSQMLYMNFFLTAPEYRNDKNLVTAIYNNYVDFAHKIGKTQICYLDTLEEPDHPLRPENPVAIEPWGHAIRGFEKMNIKTAFSWPTLQLDGSVAEEVHIVDFFVKDL